MIGCIELVKSKSGPEMFQEIGKTGSICRNHCIENGLMMRAVRDGMIMSPSLTFAREEVDEMVSKLELALNKTAEIVL